MFAIWITSRLRCQAFANKTPRCAGFLLISSLLSTRRHTSYYGGPCVIITVLSHPRMACAVHINQLFRLRKDVHCRTRFAYIRNIFTMSSAAALGRIKKGARFVARIRSSQFNFSILIGLLARARMDPLGELVVANTLT